MTMSFSLCAVIAEGAKEKQPGPARLDRRHCLPAMHGRTGCSGCTPAEPYPPSRDNKLIQSAQHPKKESTKNIALYPFNEHEQVI
jgi:hypothetical protein